MLSFLTPANTLEFLVEGWDKYVSKTFERQVNLISIENKGAVGDIYHPIETRVEDTFQTVTAFLRVLFQAEGITMYEFRDGLRINYFITDRSNRFIQLRYKVFFDTKRAMEVQVKDYLVQLQEIFAPELEKNPAARRQFMNVSYNENLVMFLKRLLNQKPEKKKYKPRFGIGGGLAINMAKISPPADDIPISRAVFEKKISPVVTLSAYFFSQRNFGKNFISPQLSILSYKHEGIAKPKTYFYGTYPGDTGIIKASIVIVELHIGRQWIRTSNFSWYTSAAPALHFFLKNASEQWEYHVDNKGRETAMGYRLQTGLIIKDKFNAWASYSRVPDTFKESKYRIRHESIQLGIQYLFGSR